MSVDLNVDLEQYHSYAVIVEPEVNFKVHVHVGSFAHHIQAQLFNVARRKTSATLKNWDWHGGIVWKDVLTSFP